MNILILMAGDSVDFSNNGFDYPKYLLEIHNKPIMQRIVESIDNIGGTVNCIIRREDQDKYYLGNMIKILSPNSNIMIVPGSTCGAICSAMFAIDKINNSDELLILNGDQFIKQDVSSILDFFRVGGFDGGIVTMEALNHKYSSVLLDGNGLVLQVSEKKPISNVASTGISYYKKGSDFIDACFSVIKKDDKINGSYYISSTFNEMILSGKKIGSFAIPKKDYISFSNFSMYKSYFDRKWR